MVVKQEPSFDPKSFLAKVGEGRSIGKYRKNQVVFSQGDAADSVFYIQRSTSPLFPSKGRKPSSPSWGRMNSAARVA
jgi:hypothetical protein